MRDVYRDPVTAFGGGGRVVYGAEEAEKGRHPPRRGKTRRRSQRFSR